MRGSRLTRVSGQLHSKTIRSAFVPMCPNSSPAVGVGVASARNAIEEPSGVTEANAIVEAIAAGAAVCDDARRNAVAEDDAMSVGLAVAAPAKGIVGIKTRAVVERSEVGEKNAAVATRISTKRSGKLTSSEPNSDFRLLDRRRIFYSLYTHKFHLSIFFLRFCPSLHLV